MAESIVSDWLNDYSTIEKSELRSFVAQHENNQEIATALYAVINERAKYPDLLYPICNQLFSFYSSNEDELRRFTLQFIPLLIYSYLNSVAQGDKKSCRSIETLLLCIYNIDVVTDDGKPKVISFRMPILAQASIYHEEKSLHAIDLRRWEENSNKDVSWGPFSHVETLNAQNRLKVMTSLLFTYNQHISLINKSALYHLCKMTSQLANQGFTKYGHVQRASYGSDTSISSKPLPRIPVSAPFLLELIHATYFAMFNEFASAAIQAVDDAHHRACYEMFSDVILVTNAIRNSLHANPSGQPSDGPMGISVALTPATNTVTVSKSMITNASFRTKKLPDDIPIQGIKDETGQLGSINEESEADVQNSNRANTKNPKDTPKVHKVPFSGFKKSKDKDKEKDKDKDKEKEKPTLKNGISLDSKDVSIKKTVKEKLTQKISLQIPSTVELNDSSLEKNSTSPLAIMKHKSNGNNVIDIIVTSNLSSGDLLPIQTINNDISKIDEQHSNDVVGVIPISNNVVHHNLETMESFDSANEIQFARNSITMDKKPMGNIQISQV